MPAVEATTRDHLTATVRALHEWLTHPHIATILPDLTAEAGRNPALAEAIAATIGQARRALGAATLRRAIERGELPDEVNLELALDLIAGPLYWRRSVRHAPVESGYLDDLAKHILRALNARPTPHTRAM